jgi:hypothetical protein
MARWLIKQLNETESDYTPLTRRARHPRTSHDQDYILADVAAKRRVLERHPPKDDPTSLLWVCSTCRGRPQWPCPEIRDAASVFARRPGYRKEWKPDD